MAEEIGGRKKWRNEELQDLYSNHVEKDEMRGGKGGGI